MDPLKTILTSIYKDQAGNILKELKDAVPQDKCPKENTKANLDWYKNFNLYVTYPNSFCDTNKCDLNALNKRLDHIQNLGTNVLHILPFLKSPMIDAGFDISDFMSVRDKLGGNEALASLIKETRKRNINIFMDVIFNHISTKHEWFIKAINGEQKYRDYFVHTKKKPAFIKKYKDENGVWAQYEFDGNTRDIRIIFPEQTGEIPHWVQADDGYWYYHTFYPHQIDVEWDNPEVFIEFAKILIYWAAKGLSFRLDAFSFVGKDIHKGKIESTPKTFQILEALQLIVKSVSPTSVFLSEIPKPIKETKEYFGYNGHKRSDLAYNFPLMCNLWTSIITQNTDELWETIKESATDQPKWAGWITFLRNHDELCLDFTDTKTRELICKTLNSKGLPFRAGYTISGRTASFLDENPKRIAMAYLMLASVPGNPAIIYGDEIGKTNDVDFMKEQTTMKRELINDNNIADDTRDINRGQIIESDINTKYAQNIYSKLSSIFKTRLENSSFFSVTPDKVTTDNTQVFAAKYSRTNKSLSVFVNLGKKEIDIDLPADSEIILNINNAKKHGNSITLAPYSGIWIIEK